MAGFFDFLLVSDLEELIAVAARPDADPDDLAARRQSFVNSLRRFVIEVMDDESRNRFPDEE